SPIRRLLDGAVAHRSPSLRSDSKLQIWTTAVKSLTLLKVIILWLFSSIVRIRNARRIGHHGDAVSVSHERLARTSELRLQRGERLRDVRVVVAEDVGPERGRAAGQARHVA